MTKKIVWSFINDKEHGEIDELDETWLPNTTDICILLYRQFVNKYTIEELYQQLKWDVVFF